MKQYQISELFIFGGSICSFFLEDAPVFVLKEELEVYSAKTGFLHLPAGSLKKELDNALANNSCFTPKGNNMQHFSFSFDGSIFYLYAWLCM